MQRSCGIVLHPTSLPGGTLGPAAYAWVDWLAEAGQSWWQVLPLGPPDGLGSPYAASSAFACWPGLLAEPDAPVSAAEVEEFRNRHAYWIGGWEAFAGPGAVEDQVRFEREWGALRRHAAARGVRIAGDIPIYVAAGSADERAHPGLFLHGDVAGAPPDPLSPLGQHWGNPLYDWGAVAQEGYRWWTERFRRSLELYDLVRIDHFRGFAGFWAIPAGAASPLEGHWLPGPGEAPFRAAEAELGPLPVFVEDLGLITEDVVALREQLGFPGMAVLIFGFDGLPDNPYHPSRHRERLVVCTSTHDTQTAAGWWATAAEHERALGAEAGIDPADPAWSLLELAYRSPAELALVLLQDALRLGDEARTNRPGTVEGNWCWRIPDGALSPELAARLRDAAARAGRLTHR